MQIFFDIYYCLWYYKYKEEMSIRIMLIYYREFIISKTFSP